MKINNEPLAQLFQRSPWKSINMKLSKGFYVDTVYDHLEDYKKTRKLKPQHGGSQSLLIVEQAAVLMRHL